MSSMGTPNKAVVVRGPELALDMVYNAVQTLVPVGATLVVAGKAYSQPDLLVMIDAVRAPLKVARDAKVALAKARVAVRDKSTGIQTSIRELRTGVRAFVGDTNPEIEKFGFKVIRPKRPLTSDELALKAERARRTRKERHTMGAKQKAAIKAEPAPSITIVNDALAADATGAPGGSTNGAAATPRKTAS